MPKPAAPASSPCPARITMHDSDRAKPSLTPLAGQHQHLLQCPTTTPSLPPASSQRPSGAAGHPAEGRVSQSVLRRLAGRESRADGQVGQGMVARGLGRVEDAGEDLCGAGTGEVMGAIWKGWHAVTWRLHQIQVGWTLEAVRAAGRATTTMTATSLMDR
jgi:hypothetical protein